MDAYCILWKTLLGKVLCTDVLLLKTDIWLYYDAYAIILSDNDLTVSSIDGWALFGFPKNYKKGPYKKKIVAESSRQTIKRTDMTQIWRYRPREISGLWFLGRSVHPLTSSLNHFSRFQSVLHSRNDPVRILTTSLHGTFQLNFFFFINCIT